MIILVTGSSGFIGTNLVNRLVKQDHYVIGVDIEDNKNFSGQLFFEVDVVSEILQHIINKYKPDIIYNLASFGSPDRYQKDPLHTIATGIDGIRNILDAIKLLPDTI